MKKIAIGVVVVVVVLAGLYFFIQSSGDKDSQVDLPAPESVEESANSLSDDIDAIETEEEQVDAQLEEIEAMPF